MNRFACTLSFGAVVLALATGSTYASVSVEVGGGPDEDSLSAHTYCEALPLPPSSGVSTALKNTEACSETDMPFFYNAGSFSHLRDCALAEKKYLTLATLYAQGLGVRQDIPLALKYACWDGHGDEVSDLKVELANPQEFDLCGSEAAGTRGIEYCLGLSANIHTAQLLSKLKVLQKHWSPHKVRAFNALVVAKMKYGETRAMAGETAFHGGSGEGESIVEDERSLDDEFMSNLEQLESGTFDAKSSSSRKPADRELAAWSKKVTTYALSFAGPPNEKLVQKSFYDYRGAWRVFLKSQYPRANVEEASIVLTRQRTSTLKALVSHFVAIPQ